jgi:hypothetical protein
VTYSSVGASAVNHTRNMAASSSPPADGPTIEPADVLTRGNRTMVLACDVQPTILGRVFASDETARASTLERMAKFLHHAREAGTPVGYVVVQFRPGSCFALQLVLC